MESEPSILCSGAPLTRRCNPPNFQKRRLQFRDVDASGDIPKYQISQVDSDDTLKVLHGRDFRVIDVDADIEIDASMPFNDLPNDSLFGLLRLCDAVTHGHRPLKDKYRNITPRQWELLESCWHDDPKERPSMSRIVEHLEQS